MNKTEARKACWTSGLKPLGYRVHLFAPALNGEIKCADYRQAMALQRAIRATLKGN
jgi:hypothetical protein